MGRPSCQSPAPWTRTRGRGIGGGDRRLDPDGAPQDRGGSRADLGPIEVWFAATPAIGHASPILAHARGAEARGHDVPSLNNREDHGPR